MNPLLVLLAIGAGALLLGGKKKASTSPGVVVGPGGIAPPNLRNQPTAIDTTPKVVPTNPTITVPTIIPTVIGPNGQTTIPPVKVTLPTDADYPAKPASGDLTPMLTQSEQYALGSYSNDQLYNEAMSSGHLAYVAAVAEKLAESGDTRAADLTLRVANWGK